MNDVSLNIDELKKRGLEFIQTQRWEEARNIYIRLSHVAPQDAEAWFMLGALHGQLGQAEEAARCGERATALRPEHADAHFNLAQAYMYLGQRERAVDCYREVLRLRPNHAVALNNLGSALQGLSQVDEAIENYQKAASLKPDYAEAHFNLAELWNHCDKQERAVDSYLKALQHRPAYVEARFGLGRAYLRLGKLHDAAWCLDLAARAKPRSAEIKLFLGRTLHKLGRLEDAAACLLESLHLKPDSVEARQVLGWVWLQQGRHDQAEQCLREALRDKPDGMGASYDCLLFSMNYLQADPDQIFREHKEWVRYFASGLSACEDYDNAPEPERRLRIGYVSPDLHAHSVAFFFEPLLAHHDAVRFETFCYANLFVPPDSFTERMRKLAGNWRDIHGLADDQVADRIREDRIDILVDLAGHTAGNRLLVFARKPAPIQVTYLGYPNTTGLTAIDYRMTDALADPPGETERYHTETLVRLPHGFLCYQPPPQITAVTTPPSTISGHVTFSSFNNLAKITPRVIATWSEILHKVDGSRLIVKNQSLRDSVTCDRYYALFAEHGIGRTRVDLIAWMPTLADHLSWYDRIDIALDTFPYNGTTTTCEALWMGVPVVTLAGRTHAARVGVSLLTQVGLPELIAEDETDYVRIAVGLANDPNRLARLHSSLRPRVAQSSLCDAPAFARDVEAAYREMWRGWCARKAP